MIRGRVGASCWRTLAVIPAYFVVFSLALLVMGCSREKTLHRVESGPVVCSLIAVENKSIDVACESSVAVQVSSIKHILWVGGGSADNELLAAPRSVSPGTPFRMTVLSPTNGELDLSKRGECTHGFQLVIQGASQSIDFPKVRNHCPL